RPGMEPVCFSGCLQHAGGNLRVADFLATWCGPCKQIKPAFGFLCKTVSNDLSLEVDVDVADCQDAASELHFMFIFTPYLALPYQY
uniref:Thioredoxin domain-containing protein n=1 Tax=Sus scrofa TaxID=9823 RepID=A0A8D1T0G7_PIG